AAKYQDPTVWLTYGNYTSHPAGYIVRTGPIPPRVAKKNTFRSYKWVTSHLRTFYAKLFHQIERKDLQWKGEFYDAAGDLAFMFPLMEMASENHYRMFDEVLYIYNVETPHNDFKEKRELQEN